jgi:hypothetical protein
LYVDHWGDAMQDAMSNNQAHLLRGPSAPEPNPTAFGCTLLAPGTPVRVDTVYGGLMQVTVRYKQTDKIIASLFRQ